MISRRRAAQQEEDTVARNEPPVPTPVVERETHPLLTATYWRQLARTGFTWAVLLVVAEIVALSVLAPGGRAAIGGLQLLAVKVIGVALLVTIYLLYRRVRPVLRNLLGSNVWVNRLVTLGLVGVYASAILFVIAVGVPALETGPVPLVQEMVGTLGAGLALAGGALSYIWTQ
jgi:hypothetical protein